VDSGRKAQFGALFNGTPPLSLQRTKNDVPCFRLSAEPPFATAISHKMARASGEARADVSAVCNIEHFARPRAPLFA